MSDPQPKATPMAMDGERQRRARRWVWGCSAGCLGSVLLLALVVFVGVRYVLGPTPIVPPSTFLTQQTSAFLCVRLGRDIPLTTETLLEVVPDRRQAEAYLSLFAPVQCVLIVQPGEQDGVGHGALAVSVRHGSRLLLAMLRKEIGGPFRQQNGAEVAPLDEDLSLALLGNNVMSTNDEDILRQWIENLNARRRREGQPASQPPAPDASPEFGRAYDRLDTEAPLVFVCLNGHKELESLASLVAEEDARRFIGQTGLAAEGVLSLSGQLKPVGLRSAELSFIIDCGDPAGAAAMKDRLQAAVVHAGKRWPLKSTTLAVRAPGLVLVSGTLDNVPAMMSGFLRAVVDRVRQLHEGRSPAPHPTPLPAGGPTIST